MSDPGKVIVAQGVEYIGRITRVWSRWNNGDESWQEYETLRYVDPDGIERTAQSCRDYGVASIPPHVKMVPTADILKKGT